MESLTVLSFAAMCKSRLTLSLVAMQSTKNSTNLAGQLIDEFGPSLKVSLRNVLNRGLRLLKIRMMRQDEQ